jgi:hypothetical protein
VPTVAGCSVKEGAIISLLIVNRGTLNANLNASLTSGCWRKLVRLMVDVADNSSLTGSAVVNSAAQL